MMSNGSDGWGLPPDLDEIEISIFGPGYGECVVAHLGENEWIVLDSCLDKQTKRPQALCYLEGLGLDPLETVSRVVASHWHDDHIGGLGELFETAKNAEFWCSMALSSSEWLTLVELQRDALSNCGSGVREMHRIMDELRNRSKKREAVSPKFAIEGRTIFSRTGSKPAFVEALAPSDAAVRVMHAEFGKLLCDATSRIARVPSMGPNDGSVAISLSVGDSAVLLGADLEDKRIGGLGWMAVLSYVGPDCVKHDGFKIPHHGSPTGHHPDVWPTMMEQDAWSVTTPWRRASGLPKPTDAARILSESGDNSYLTASPHRSKHKHPDPAVKRTLKEMGVNLYQSIGSQGHVRLRRKIDESDNWRAEIFGSALKLADVQWPST